MLNAELIYQWTLFVQCCHHAVCLPALCATGAALPGTAASAILLPASARLQQIQREKSAVAAVAAETRKNMRRLFSVHSISFIARHQHQGVQWALCLHDQLNSGEQRSVASDTRAGPQLVFYTQILILLKQFWAGLPSSHHTGHWTHHEDFITLRWWLPQSIARPGGCPPSPPTLDILDSRLMQWGFIMSSCVTFCEHPRPFN